MPAAPGGPTGIAACSACPCLCCGPGRSHGHRCLLCLRLALLQPREVPRASLPALPVPTVETCSPAEGQLPGVSTESPAPLQPSPFQACFAVASHSGSWESSGPFPYEAVPLKPVTIAHSRVWPYFSSPDWVSAFPLPRQNAGGHGVCASRLRACFIHLACEIQFETGLS